MFINNTGSISQKTEHKEDHILRTVNLSGSSYLIIVRFIYISDALLIMFLTNRRHIYSASKIQNSSETLAIINIKSTKPINCKRTKHLGQILKSILLCCLMVFVVLLTAV